MPCATFIWIGVALMYQVSCKILLKRLLKSNSMQASIGRGMLCAIAVRYTDVVQDFINHIQCVSAIGGDNAYSMLLLQRCTPTVQLYSAHAAYVHCTELLQQ